MSIMWKYLDKRQAAVAAIKDYESMQFIINTTDDEIKRTYDKMSGVSSPRWDGMPRVHNPQATEERILNAIDEIDVQLIMERLGGGGHLNVAGAQVENSTLEQVKRQIQDTIDILIDEGEIKL